ncbi:MAG: hypothetical protein ACP5NK_03270 [Thermoplasmata archaeon]
MSIILAIISIGLAFAAVRYTTNYGILSALVAGISVGSGILFSDGIQNITDKLEKEKLIGLGLLMAASATLVIIVVPGTQYKLNDLYYLNLTGLLIEIPFVFSVTAFVHTALLFLVRRKKSRTNEDGAFSD